MKNKNKKGIQRKTLVFNILAIICIILFCVAISPVTMQNDTYYTVKVGESIIENGIDGKDHFSWHENLNYEYPHWLYDVITYKIYKLGGFQGLYQTTILIFMIIRIIFYFANIKKNKSYFISLLFSILAMIMLARFITTRAQLITYLLFLYYPNNKIHYISLLRLIINFHFIINLHQNQLLILVLLLL